MNDEELEQEEPSAEELAAALEQMPAWQLDTPPEADAVGQAVPEAPEEVTHGPTPVSEPPPPSETNDQVPPPLPRILEALLFIGGPPLTAVRAAEVVRGLDEQLFHEAVDELNRTYRVQGRPYHVQLQDQGYVLTLRPRFQGVREKLFGGVKEARLSPAAVDVLSLVAYRQPATRQEVDSLRGADSGAVLRQLIRHGLVAIQRSEEDKEIRYVTTPRFLQLFGLTSLDDLPQTQDLQRM
jgi:segregation and condensation protein B